MGVYGTEGAKTLQTNLNVARRDQRMKEHDTSERQREVKHGYTWRKGWGQVIDDFVSLLSFESNIGTL